MHVLRRIAVWPLLAAGALLLAGRSMAGTGPARGASPLDSAWDRRLEKKVRLRAEGIPLSRVLPALGEKTGVRLTVAERVGDERLVAFVPEAPLAEVMRSIADLYRLDWE